MKYTEIKSFVQAKLQEYLGKGMGQDKAENRILHVAVEMVNEQKLGIIDLKYIFQILGYRFAEELAENMEKAKQTIRERYHLNDGIKYFTDQGLDEEAAVEAVISDLYDLFKEGKIQDLDDFDGLLWALGYRLKEQFILDYYEGKDSEFAYEKDE